MELVEKTQGSKSAQYNTALTEVELLREKINDISSGKNTTNNSLLYMSLNSIPKYQKEYIQLYREIEIQLWKLRLL